METGCPFPVKGHSRALAGISLLPTTENQELQSVSMPSKISTF